MKVSGIELIQMINEGKIEENQKIKCDRFSGGIYIVYEGKNLNIYIGSDRYEENSNLGVISAMNLLEYDFEIVESEKDEPIEKIFGFHHPSTKRLDLIKEDIELAFKTIDKLIDEVNKLKKESDR